MPMHHPPRTAKFWKVSDYGAPDYKPGMARWSVSLRIKIVGGPDLGAAQPILDWDSHTVVECEKPHVFEDMPWCGSYSHLMSQRMRDVIERAAPEQVQWLPVVMCHEGKRIEGCPNYFVANYLHMCDSADEQLTPRSENNYLDLITVDPRKVPSHVMLHRNSVMDTNVIVRSQIYNALNANGITKPLSLWYPLRTTPGVPIE